MHISRSLYNNFRNKPEGVGVNGNQREHLLTRQSRVSKPKSDSEIQRSAATINCAFADFPQRFMTQLARNTSSCIA